MNAPAPLHGTPPSDAVSNGPRLAQVAELMGLDLFGWQRQVADVGLERDEFGHYTYRTVGVSVGAYRARAPRRPSRCVHRPGPRYGPPQVGGNCSDAAAGVRFAV